MGLHKISPTSTPINRSAQISPTSTPIKRAAQNFTHVNTNQTGCIKFHPRQHQVLLHRHRSLLETKSGLHVIPTAELHLETKWRMQGVIPPLPTQIHYKDKAGTQREKNVISRNYRQNKRLNNPTFSANTIYHKCLQPCVDIRPHAMRR